VRCGIRRAKAEVVGGNAGHHKRMKGGIPRRLIRVGVEVEGEVSIAGNREKEIEIFPEAIDERYAIIIRTENLLFLNNLFLPVEGPHRQQSDLDTELEPTALPDIA